MASSNGPNRVLNWFRAKQNQETPASASKSEKALEQSQKMEAIGRLAGGVAHDFNNLLAVITGYSDLLLDDVALSDTNRTKIEQIKQAANSAASLTRQLLMFSRQQVIEPVILDINQIVTNTEKMLRRLIKENIEFMVVPDKHLTRVKADPGQIEQIVVNLVVNARDAMPNGGKLRIQTKNVLVDAHSARPEAGLSHGRFAVLEVSDTGIGMDQQTQAHIFEPFFTTKAVGEGTGLGLATVYGIVQQSNGYIDVDSEIGRGSTFKIYFPSAQPAAAEQETGNEAAKSRFAGETVVVVEDSPALLGLIREALSASGCEVVTARDGEEALRIVREKKGRIDLLLTDVVMPRMNGATLAKEVRELSQQAKILYMTGYSGEFVRADMLTQGVSFIQKPFTPAELGRKIRKMLGEKVQQGSAEGSSRSAKSAAAGS